MDENKKIGTYEDESLGIKFTIEERGNQRFVVLEEQDFNTIFSKVYDLQEQVIKNLKQQALIRNILDN
ncbi:hypothetical protein [Microscilla marina]|uniref:Uncharacterized protein n=1 Tax=Microscilla marina ATCC 23134 TaxID=313606 RepID=A1ZFJ7_MICM2|nr:hypothetical protein [Microscilla marina]EAY30771.1 hypothetical protein M23134_01095 [Microscilla marina ATCC 23134]